MERGKGGLTGWSAGAFRSHSQASDRVDAASTSSAQNPPAAASARGAETFSVSDPGGRFSGPGSISGSSYDVVIAPGCTVQGKLELKGRALVNARVEGELRNDVELVVGEQGAIEGNLTGTSIRVFGSVKGDISCTGRLELRSGATVTGNLASPSLVIEDGVVFEGHCRMWDPRGAAGTGQPAGSDSSAAGLDDDFEDDAVE